MTTETTLLTELNRARTLAGLPPITEVAAPDEAARSVAQRVADLAKSISKHGVDNEEVVDKRAKSGVYFVDIGDKYMWSNVSVRSPSNITVKWHQQNPLGAANIKNEKLPEKGTVTFKSVDDTLDFLKALHKDSDYGKVMKIVKGK